MGSPLRISQVNDLLADEERRLIAGGLEKDRKATAQFVEYCSKCAYPFVRRRLMPRVDLAEDLTQEILLGAWRMLPQFRAESSLKTWVLGIARHKVEDYYRKRIREFETPEEEDSGKELILPPRVDENLQA